MLPISKTRVDWASRSFLERANVYLRVRAFGSMAIFLTVLVIYFFDPHSLTIYKALLLIALDLFLLVVLRLFMRYKFPRVWVWASLIFASVAGAVGIHVGGGVATLQVGVYMILILAASLVFLRWRETVTMGIICGALYVGMVIAEYSQVLPPHSEAFGMAYLAAPDLFIVNAVSGMILLVLTVVLAGGSAESLGRWGIEMEAEVQRKNTELAAALESEKRLSNSLRLLSDINELIVRERSSQTLLDEICNLIVSTGYTYAWIGQLHKKTETIEVVARAGYLAQETNLILNNVECVLRAIRSAQRVTVLHGQDDLFCADCILKDILNQHITLAIPLQREERIFGVLVVSHQSNLRDSDSKLFQEVADDLAYALENLEMEAQRQALAQTAEFMLTSRNEPEFWDSVLNAAKTILGADRAATYVYDSASDSLSCPYFSGLSQEYVDIVNRNFRQLPASQILKNPVPVCIQDVDTDPRAEPMRPFMQQEGIRSYAAFPLFSAEKILGTLVVYRNRKQVFGKFDVEAGQTLAHLAAVSLQNTRMFIATRAKAAEQAALYAAAQDMAASLLNPGALLENFARHLAVVLDATSVYISSLDANEEYITIIAEYFNASASENERKSDLLYRYPTSEYESFLQALKSAKARVVHFDEEGLPPQEKNEYDIYGVQTKLLLPLFSQGKLVGHSEVWESRRKREFTQNEINLAQAMASYAANVIHTTNLFSDLESAYDATLEGWARALELRDKDTEGHTRRVTNLAVCLARAMSVPEADVLQIRRGAILHDIGKMAVPDSILQKPGALTTEERAIIEQHPQLAYDMLSGIEFLKDAIDIPYCHHEYWDGTGYPRGLKGEAIPISARIFAIVDVWDALMSDRPYRPAWTHQAALRYVQERSEVQFDPRVVDEFIKVVIRGDVS